MNKEQNFIEYWLQKLPELKSEFDKEIKVMNDDCKYYDDINNNDNHCKNLQNNDYLDKLSGCYKDTNNRVYHLMSTPIVDYFDELIRSKNAEKLKVFFSDFDEFYNHFKGEFISKENIPNDLIIDILYTYIFEGIAEENIEFAKPLMSGFIRKEYDEWLKQF